MLALCLMLSVTYYAQNYAGIIGWSLLITQSSFCLQILREDQYVNVNFDSAILCKTLFCLFESDFKWSIHMYYCYIKSSTCYPHLIFLLFHI